MKPDTETQLILITVLGPVAFVFMLWYFWW